MNMMTTNREIGDLRDNDAYDILRQSEDLWSLYARKEEYTHVGLDAHGRFSYSSGSNSYADISDPLLSRYLVNEGFKTQYPEGKKFAICLTHDVDEIYPPPSHALLSSFCHLRNLDLKGLKGQILWRRWGGRQLSPYWNFKEIMAIEEKFDAKSTFYFLAADRDIKRFRYEIEVLEDELCAITDGGWEVGLHGGYYAYDRWEEMAKEKRRLEGVLGREIIGYRNHYLRFRVPDTWEHLAKAGFKYDSTFGYADVVGFRNGMCHPFRPYNLKTDSYIDILEIPLCIMDMALWGMRSKSNAAGLWETLNDLMKVVERYGGVLTILWHNNVFDCPFRETLCKLYTKILAEGRKRNAWLTSAEEIRRWWIDY
jgi:peptidoglycan/xylan/chitin deacetylase (PgdA/CDA1 family)